MAKIDNNHLVKGARGNFAKEFVYKRRGKNTHIARMPKIDKNAEPTDKQVEVRDSFGSAALYASGAMESSELKQQYEKKAVDGKTAFNIAFRDYLKAPVVKKIDPENYNGTPGSTIVVTAKDDFRVVEVKVRIFTGARVLVEEGNAVLNPVNRNQWIYTATQANIGMAGSSIQAIVKDLPGNTGTLEAVI
jgi:hypothetical protein